MTKHADRARGVTVSRYAKREDPCTEYRPYLGPVYQLDNRTIVLYSMDG